MCMKEKENVKIFFAHSVDFPPTRYNPTSISKEKKYPCGMGKSIRLDIFPHFSVVYIVWSEKRNFFLLSLMRRLGGKENSFFYCVSCLPACLTNTLILLLPFYIGNCFIFTIENEVSFLSALLYALCLYIEHGITLVFSFVNMIVVEWIENMLAFLYRTEQRKVLCWVIKTNKKL